MLISSKIFNGINGKVIIPGDKSISHRSIIISSISNGDCEISNLLFSEDVINTLNAFENLGVKIERDSKKIKISGKGLNSLKKPKKIIELGNSGTSARLLIGLLSSQNFDTLLSGDSSLSKRPMDRITKPLELMGAKFKSNNGKLPIEIYGKKLNNFDHELNLPSAQVKSGLILAALNTEGETRIIEKHITRNHTEIMLESFGCDINVKKINSENHIYLKGNKELISRNINIPSDLSSAAFFIVAALINESSHLQMTNINLNETRTGILKALDKMGANIKINNVKTINGEKVGDIEIASSNLKGCELDNDFARLMIDEYPILSIAAAFANSPSTFKGLEELKVKESNRLELIKHNLNQCGIYCKINGNDLFIDPTNRKDPINNEIVTNNDHRIAMSFAIMGTRLGSSLKILDSEFIKTSFPKFKETLNHIGGNLDE